MRALNTGQGISLFVLGALVLAATSPAHAGEISWQEAWPAPCGPVPWLAVDHVPAPAGAGGASDLSYSISPFWQQIASDFSVQNAGIWNRLVWWGFYNNDVRPAQPELEQFRFRLYDVRPGDGLPGNQLWEETITNPGRTLTGRRIVIEDGGPFEFRYDVNLSNPVALLANTVFWLEIVQVDDISTIFRWEASGTDGMGQAFKNPVTVDWRLTTNPADTAYQIWLVPEPSGLAMVCLSIIALSYRRKEVPID